MVNLIAGRAIIAELMQNEMRGDRLAAEAIRLLDNEAVREQMRKDLAEVAAKLTATEDPIRRAATIVERLLKVNQGATHGA
jgi:lipid A disaccharide synthetase